MRLLFKPIVTPSTLQNIADYFRNTASTGYVNPLLMLQLSRTFVLLNEIFSSNAGYIVYGLSGSSIESLATKLGIDGIILGTFDMADEVMEALDAAGGRMDRKRTTYSPKSGGKPREFGTARDKGRLNDTRNTGKTSHTGEAAIGNFNASTPNLSPRIRKVNTDSIEVLINEKISGGYRMRRVKMHKSDTIGKTNIIDVIR